MSFLRSLRFQNNVRYQRIAVSIVVVILITLMYIYPKSIQKIDTLVGDIVTRGQLSQLTPSKISIIDIDDQSLQSIHSWPWPRDLMAQLIKKLVEEQGPHAILLDIVMPEKTGEFGEFMLEDIVKNAPVCLSQAFDLNRQNQERQIGFLADGNASSQGAQHAYGYVGNYDDLSASARCVGHITPYYGDGVIREYPIKITWNNQAWYSLVDSTLIAYDNWSPDTTRGLIQKIPYQIEPNSWQVISAQAILLGQLPAQFLKGKYVLIGSSALGLSDRVTTPIHPWLPGVVIHAEMLNYRLSPPKTLITLKPNAWLYSVFCVVVIAFFIARAKLLTFVALTLTLSVTWFLWVSQVWYLYVDLLPSLPLISLFLQAIIQFFYEWLVVHRQNRKVTRLFKNYVPEAVVKQLLLEADDYTEPTIKEITVLFADIEGYTRMAKNYTPQQTAAITKDVLTLITEAVYANQGTLDKYLGDAVMAFWNAPLTQQYHAQKALDAANQIQRRLQHYNTTSAIPPISVRIGIHTGQAMVGELGTHLRHAYTAIGDTVNKAHRLHEYTKKFGVHILISEETYQQLNDKSHVSYKVVNIHDLLDKEHQDNLTV
ncbi:MAG: CHASE2 domain-containing protein [Thiomicrospira sp.]